MRDQRRYTENDDAPMLDGDNGFIGVDMRTSPHLLQPGYVAEARNARFRYGVAEPRKGVAPLAWGRVGYAFEWPIQWDEGDIDWGSYLLTRFNKVYGYGVWNDPNGNDWIFVAASINDVSVKIYKVRQGNAVTEVPVSVPLAIPTSTFQDDNTEDVYWFTQAFNTCILSRGSDDKHLVLSDITEGFVEAPDAIVDGLDNIPNAKSTLFFQNRLLVPHTPSAGYKADHVAVSDILDYTSYDPVYASFKINQGDSDEIERLFKFNDTTVVVFKSTSIYAVSNLQGDWSTNAVLDQITTEYGIVGSRSVANTGDDLWFLSQRGVVSLRQTELNKLQGVNQPQSAAIQPVIDRIDFKTAKETACAAYWRDRYYLSVPLDGGQQNNAVLVYDFLNKAWSGYDDGDAIKIKYLFVSDFSGSEHLYYIDYDGTLGLYEWGETEGTLTAQSSYTCDLLVKGHPLDGSSLRVNGGTTVTATRHRELVIDDEATEIVDDGGDNIVESLETNENDAQSGWLWGVGYDTPADPTALPADNLWAGFNSDGWVHNTDTVAELDEGVRFTNSTPIVIQHNDPYVQAICSHSEEIEDKPIDFQIITRGYGFDGASRRRFQGTNLFISTWDPKYKVTAIVDGVKEEQVLIDDTTFTFPSRTKYLTFGTEDWAITNTGQDHATAGREDYSVILDATLGGGTLLDATGTQLDLYQYWKHNLRVNRRGSYYQVKIEVTDGRVRIHSITSQDTPGQRREGQHAGVW